MPDRYDDSVPRRPVNGGGSRRTEAPRTTEEDPLVELARLVSGTENFDDIIGKRPAAAAPPARSAAASRAQPRDASFDLESELLSDLQSSFDAPPPRAATAPPRAPQRDSSFDTMRLRSGGIPPAPPMTAAQPRYTDPAPARNSQVEDDPYLGTAYAGAAGYDSYADSGRTGSYRTAPPAVDEASGYAAAYSDREDYRDQDYGGYEQGLEGSEGDEDDGVYDEEPTRRSRKGLIIAAIVLGLILVGGAGAIALRSNGSSLMGNSTPKVIAADDGPTKVKPAVQPDSDGGQQNKLIYDRASPDTGANDQLVVPNDSTADSTPANTESQGSREISRIILPGAPGDQSAPDSNTPPLASSADTSEPDAGPRKVRTVVVKPDGTIISSEAQPKGDGSSGTPSTTALNDGNTIAPAPLQPADPPAGMTAPPANPPPLPAPSSTADSDASKDNSQLAPPPEPKPVTTRKQVAAASPPARPAPASGTDTSVSTGGTGGFVVQVSSQRTEEQARTAYKDLQRKFPSILATRAASFPKVDLGSKGVFYRALIGPWSSRDDAATFCQELRSAGGSCVIPSKS